MIRPHASSSVPVAVPKPGFAEALPNRASARPSPLQRRAEAGGLAALTDREVLELHLRRAQVAAPRRVAARALERFGCLAAVIGAPMAELSLATTPAAAMALKLLHDTAIRLARAEVARRDVLSSHDAVVTYLKVLLAGQPREQVWILFLDKKNQLLLIEKISEGTVDHAPVYPREVVRRALEVNAAALILVHNHPSGDPTPSAADVTMTREVICAAQALKIVVHDHMVVGHNTVASLRALRLI